MRSCRSAPLISRARQQEGDGCDTSVWMCTATSARSRSASAGGRDRSAGSPAPATRSSSSPPASRPTIRSCWNQPATRWRSPPSCAATSRTSCSPIRCRFAQLLPRDREVHELRRRQAQDRGRGARLEPDPDHRVAGGQRLDHRPGLRAYHPRRGPEFDRQLDAAVGDCAMRVRRGVRRDALDPDDSQMPRELRSRRALPEVLPARRLSEGHVSIVANDRHGFGAANRPTLTSIHLRFEVAAIDDDRRDGDARAYTPAAPRPRPRT
jgi:hypothetical protein